jgi:hypothetical protein
VRLARHAGSQRSIRLCAAALLTTAFAGLVGGSSHGFAPALSLEAREAFRIVTAWSIGLSSLFLLAACVVAATTGALRTGLLAVLIARLLGYAAYAIFHRDFRYVIYDYALSLAALFVLALQPRLRGPRRAGAWILAGLAASLVAAAVQRSALAFAGLNHNDLFHLIQTAGIFFYYGAGRRLDDAPTA